jgi:hypothetical protein
MSLQTITPVSVENFVAQNDQCPTLDQWLAGCLSVEHQGMYVLLIQLRQEAGGNQYPVDFDVLWKELGYTRKDNAKSHMERVIDDFEVSLRPQDNPQGGRPTEIIHLTLDAAQRFALHAGTEKSKEIANFFVQTMKAVQEYHLLTLHYEKNIATAKAAEDALLSTVSKGKRLMYLGDLGMIGGESMIKAGSTDDGDQRFPRLKRDYPNGCTLYHLTEHNDNRELENQFKHHAQVKSHQRDVVHNGKTFTECFVVNNQMTKEKYVKIVQQIAKGIADRVDRSWAHEEKMKELELETERERRLQLETRLEMMRLESRAGGSVEITETMEMMSADVHRDDEGDPTNTPVRLAHEERMKDLNDDSQLQLTRLKLESSKEIINKALDSGRSMDEITALLSFFNTEDKKSNQQRAQEDSAIVEPAAASTACNCGSRFTACLLARQDSRTAWRSIVHRMCLESI